MARAQGSQGLRDLLKSLARGRAELALEGVLADVRQALAVDAIVFLQLTEELEGWRVDAFHSDNLSDAARVRRALGRHLGASHALPRWLDPRCSRSHRNVPIVVDGTRDDYETHALHDAVLVPAGLGEHHLAKVHLCEGELHLGWLGCFDTRPFAADTLRGLESIATALQTRLHEHRTLVDGARYRAALATTLDQLGAPALLVDVKGSIHECNTSARELLTTRRRDVASSIHALLARRSPALPFSLIRLPTDGAEHHLAVLRPRSPEARMDLAVSIAAARWRLTKRQHQVLGRLVRGESNHDIAQALAITTRTTEMHVSALFERALVENRAALVAAVLLG